MSGNYRYQGGDFEPYCRRCGKRIVWGSWMGEAVNGLGKEWFHANKEDCGAIDNTWVKPGGDKPEEAA